MKKLFGLLRLQRFRTGNNIGYFNRRMLISEREISLFDNQLSFSVGYLLSFRQVRRILFRYIHTLSLGLFYSLSLLAIFKQLFHFILWFFQTKTIIHVRKSSIFFWLFNIFLTRLLNLTLKLLRFFERKIFKVLLYLLYNLVLLRFVFGNILFNLYGFKMIFQSSLLRKLINFLLVFFDSEGWKYRLIS